VTVTSDRDSGEWLTPPKAPETTGPSPHDPSAWHYTNSAGLEGILNSGVLWACSTDGLNDSEEVRYGVIALRRLWERVKPVLVGDAPIAAVEEWITDIEVRALARDVLVVCACQDGNSLLHWQAYAKIDDGYAIELTPTVEYKILTREGQQLLYQPDDVPAIFWRCVIYGEKDPEWGWGYWDPTRRLIEGALDAFAAQREGRVRDEKLMREHLDRQYLAIVYAYKHEGFSAEQEQRLIVVRPAVDGYTSTRDSRYGPSQKAILAAVVEADPELYTVADKASLPIKSIQLAPRNPERDEQRVRDLLEATGYADVAVTRSTTPIR
jgi:hypothetical protein